MLQLQQPPKKLFARFKLGTQMEGVMQQKAVASNQTALGKNVVHHNVVQHDID